MPDSNRVLPLFRVLAVMIIAVAALRVAWISDDALITLRTALNITHNWGPGFNATESVQAYTHPLWFLLWVGIGAWTNQWILGIFALGIACVVIASSLLVKQVQSLARLLVVVVLLLLSNSFIDYTSSGLENPLSYAVVATLMSLTLQSTKGTRLQWWWPILVGLTSAAIVLTRMDLAVLISVPLMLLAWQHRRNARLLGIGATAFLIPLIIWFAWTYVTYSAWLPNTFAAKTNAQVPRSEMMVQGLRYLWVTFENDPVTLIGLLVGIGVGLVIGPRTLRGWSLGALSYVTYVVWIGGDFMAGRFLAVPFFVAVFILAASPLKFFSPQSATDTPTQNHKIDSAASIAAALGMTVLLVVTIFTAGISVTSLANPQQPRWTVDQNLNADVDDARGLSVADGDSLEGMIDSLSLEFVDPDIVPIGDGSGLGRALRNLDKSAANWPINDGTFTRPSEVGVFCGYLGNIGIATGPITHLIDSCALTDRFLAEREYTPEGPFTWKPGHFDRSIPDGYIEAVALDDATQMIDPADAFELARLWAKIR